MATDHSEEAEEFVGILATVQGALDAYAEVLFPHGSACPCTHCQAFAPVGAGFACLERLGEKLIAQARDEHAHGQWGPARQLLDDCLTEGERI